MRLVSTHPHIIIVDLPPKKRVEVQVNDGFFGCGTGSAGIVILPGVEGDVKVLVDGVEA